MATYIDVGENIVKLKPIKPLRIALALFCLSVLAGCASIGGQHYIQEFEVTVVDAETGDPLEGVIMLAGWYQVRTTLHGDEGAGTRAIKEAVSDENGRIHLPRSIEKGTTQPFAQVDRESNPYFVLYKEGYIDIYYRNVTEGGDVMVYLRGQPNQPDGTPFVFGANYARWHKSTIRLERLPEDYDKERTYVRSKFRSMVGKISNRLGELELGTKCDWDLIPMSRVAAYKMYAKYNNLSQEKMNNRIERNIASNDSCNVIFDVFKEKYL